MESFYMYGVFVLSIRNDTLSGSCKIVLIEAYVDSEISLSPFVYSLGDAGYQWQGWVKQFDRDSSTKWVFRVWKIRIYYLIWSW